MKIAETEGTIQRDIDLEKWLDSEAAGRDTCGEYEFCAFCDKSVKNPCGTAYKKMREKEENEAEKAQYVEFVRLRRSFMSRLIQNAEIQPIYSVLRNILLGYKNVKSRITTHGEIFRFGKEKIAVIGVKGKTIYLYLNIDGAKLVGTKYHFEEVIDNLTYEGTPVRIRVKGGRSQKFARELVAMIAEEKGMTLNEKYKKTEFFADYESDEMLVNKGLIKKYVALKRTR